MARVGLAAALVLALSACAALPQDPEPGWKVPEELAPARPASQVPS